MNLNCRNCFREIQNETALYIFETNNKEHSVAEILRLFISVMISEEDNLPKVICLDCFEKLNVSYNFQKLVITSEFKFLQLLQKKCDTDELDDSTFLKNESNINEDDWEWATQNVILKEKTPLSSDFGENIQTFRSNDKGESAILYSSMEHNEEGYCEKNEVFVLKKFEADTHISNHWKNYSLRNIRANYQKMRQSNNMYVCWICGKTFKQLLLLKLHRFTHLNKNCIVCVKCNAKFLDKRHFLWHFRARHAENPREFPCNICGKSLRNLHLLRNHDKKHAGENISNFDMISNCRTHTGEKSYQYAHCDHAQKNELIQHKRRHIGEKLFQCIQCYHRFSTKGNLVTHMRTHIGEKPFQCIQCNNKFSTKGNLVTHMRTHTGEKPFQCIQCNRRFSTKGILITHIRIHTGEKLFQCNHCDRTFYTKANLVTHIRAHTGEKPYQCTQCDRRFSTKGTLSTHIRTHTGETPYQYIYCDPGFAYRSKLTHHI